MQRFYSDRETYGPEFDDRLIKLVRASPAIYDVSHPHYRRNPVRVAIWARIANELCAPSRFLQTKWKNIRYNYLQEIKSLETGHPNANVRKRRFTEDLSFLQNTAQSYNVKKSANYKNSSYNSSDTDSNSYMYPDAEQLRSDAFEVIEIEHSDDDSSRQDDASMNGSASKHTKIDDYDNIGDDELLTELVTSSRQTTKEPIPDVTIEQTFNTNSKMECGDDKKDVTSVAKAAASPTPSYLSNASSSSLLTPLVVMSNGEEQKTNGEVTIEPIIKPTALRNQTQTITTTTTSSKPQRSTLNATEIMSNAAKRKSMPAPTLPALTPINDPTELYCLSLVDSLRNMPRSERERVKFEFANILKDAKYKDQS